MDIENDIKSRILTPTNIFRLKNIERINEYLKNPQAKAQFYRRIHERVNDALKELEFIATQLPAKHRSKTFNNTNMLPFLKAVLSKPYVKNETPYVKDIQLFHLCLRIAQQALYGASRLIKENYRQLFTQQIRGFFPDHRDLQMLTTLYYMSKKT